MEAQNDNSRLSDYMDGWLVEKSKHILTSIVLLYEDFKRRGDLPEDFRENFLFHLYPILWDSTKILSFASYGQWSTEDRELILEKGQTGLEEVLVRYGLLDETKTKQARRKSQLENLLESIDKIEELLCGQRYPSRTLIHELLLKLGNRDPIIDRISGLTEKVTMGELPWGEYVECTSRLIKDLKAKYCDSDIA